MFELFSLWGYRLVSSMDPDLWESQKSHPGIMHFGSLTTNNDSGLKFLCSNFFSILGINSYKTVCLISTEEQEIVPTGPQEKSTPLFVICCPNPKPNFFLKINFGRILQPWCPFSFNVNWLIIHLSKILWVVGKFDSLGYSRNGDFMHDLHSSHTLYRLNVWSLGNMCNSPLGMVASITLKGCLHWPTSNVSTISVSNIL